MNDTGLVWRNNLVGKCRTLGGNAFRRRVILHYHLFKNAGSSVDHVLASNFGGRWQVLEGTHSWSVVKADDVAAYIRHHKRVLAVSSHHFRLPLPVMPEADLYPIFFLRHPIDRIASVHQFGKRSGIGLTESSRNAVRGSLRDYVAWMLADKGNEGNNIRNAQTLFLSSKLSAWTDPSLPLRADDALLEEAQGFLRTLPVFGLVEKFDESARRFGAWLAHAFPGINFFPTQRNTRPERHQSLEERLAAIETELGQSLYQELQAANHHDLELYRFASNHFEGQGKS